MKRQKWMTPEGDRLRTIDDLRALLTPPDEGEVKEALEWAETINPNHDDCCTFDEGYKQAIVLASAYRQAMGREKGCKKALEKMGPLLKGLDSWELARDADKLRRLALAALAGDDNAN